MKWLDRWRRRRRAKARRAVIKSEPVIRAALEDLRPEAADVGMAREFLNIERIWLEAIDAAKREELTELIAGARAVGDRLR